VTAIRAPQLRADWPLPAWDRNHLLLYLATDGCALLVAGAFHHGAGAVTTIVVWLLGRAALWRLCDWQESCTATRPAGAAWRDV